MAKERPLAVPTVQVDTERVKVTEWRFPPGGHTGWHRHEMDYVVVPITTGRLDIDDGKQVFAAELVFYPAREPLRAMIAQRQEVGEARDPAWPEPPAADPLAPWSDALLAAPWRLEAPILLPPGRIAEDASGRAWWLAGEAALPLDAAPPTLALGARIEAAAGVWNGARLALLSARTDWGRLAFDG